MHFTVALYHLIYAKHFLHCYFYDYTVTLQKKNKFHDYIYFIYIYIHIYSSGISELQSTFIDNDANAWSQSKSVYYCLNI